MRVDVWHLAVAPGAMSRWAARVSEAERDRAARLRRKQDAAAFLASRALLRAVLGARLGVAPGAVQVTRVCEHCGDLAHGRPRVAGLELSLTRAASVTALAVAHVPVGLDAEGPRPGVSALFHGPAGSEHDRAMLAAAGTGEDGALALWVAKEAVGKLSGLGLEHAAGIRVPIPSARPESAADARGGPCWVVRLELPGAAAAALALREPAPEVRLLDAAALGL